MADLGENVFQIKHRSCRKPDGSNWKIGHGPFLIDKELATIECENCGAQVNATTVLMEFAHYERKLAERYALLKKEIEKVKFKAERQNRVRCEHCARLTRIRK